MRGLTHLSETSVYAPNYFVLALQNVFGVLEKRSWPPCNAILCEHVTKLAMSKRIVTLHRVGDPKQTDSYRLKCGYRRAHGNIVADVAWGVWSASIHRMKAPDAVEKKVVNTHHFVELSIQRR